MKNYSFFKKAYDQAKEFLISSRPDPSVGWVCSINNQILSIGSSKNFQAKGYLNTVLSICQPSFFNETGKIYSFYLTEIRYLSVNDLKVESSLLEEIRVKKHVIQLYISDKISNNQNMMVQLKKIKDVIQIQECTFPSKITKEILALNHFYNKGKENTEPWVSIKYAMTLDGKIARSNYNSKWISNQKSRYHTHHLRALNDSIMVGENTVIRDNPSLTVRLESKNVYQPLRIVINTKTMLPKDYKVFDKEAKTLFIINELFDREYKNYIQKQKHEYWEFPQYIKFKSLFKKLKHEKKVNSILVEGGANIHYALLYEKLIKECHVFVAPKLFGDGKHSLSPFTRSENCSIQDDKKLSQLSLINIKYRLFENNIYYYGDIYYN